MNANELAVYLEDITDWVESPYRQAATMLRQQQDEIEALKQIIDANNLNQNIGQFVKPINEPVAWIPKGMTLAKPKDLTDCIPLYTHPVKEQSTNERIEMLKEMVEKIANPAGWIGYYEGKPATFLFKQEDVPRFLKNTDPVGSVIPLYTHPVKELTDEEIQEIVADKYEKGHGRYIDTDLFFIEFARAILRKAQK